MSENPWWKPQSRVGWMIYVFLLSIPVGLVIGYYTSDAWASLIMFGAGFLLAIVLFQDFIMKS